MTKVELIHQVANEAGINKSEARRAVDAVVKAIMQVVDTHGRLALPPLGTFKKRLKPDSLHPNPKEPGRKVLTQAHNVVSFKSAPGFKLFVNHGKATVKVPA